MIERLVERVLEVDPWIAFRVSVGCLACAVGVALSTLLPGAPLLPDFVVFPLVLMAILANFRTVLLLRSWRAAGLTRREVMAPLPILLWVAAGCLALLVWVLLFASISGSVGGQPIERMGHYYLNDHGAMIPITRSRYVAERIREQQSFALISSVFCGLAAIVAWLALRKPMISVRQSDQPG